MFHNEQQPFNVAKCVSKQIKQGTFTAQILALFRTV